MARRRGRTRSSRANALARTDDGGLLVNDAAGEPFQVVPPEVAAALRFFVTRTQTSEFLSENRVVAVTSSLAGEGVTFTARSLGAILAHDLRRSVCIVEANWWHSPNRRPSPDDEIAPPGLADILEGTATLDDALIPTSDSRLFLLPAGTAPMALRPVIVASNEFTSVLDKIASRFDTVVLDVPPVLLASEAITICDRSDAAILVVEQGVTSEREVARAVEELEGVHVLGLLLNRTASRVPRLLRSLTVPT